MQAPHFPLTALIGIQQLIDCRRGHGRQKLSIVVGDVGNRQVEIEHVTQLRQLMENMFKQLRGVSWRVGTYY